MNKMSWAVCILLLFLITGCLITGCQQSQSAATTTTATTTTTASTTTTMPPVTSFWSINLGDTTSEVIALHGTPTSTSSTTFLTYTYPLGYYEVYFDLTSQKVVAVASSDKNLGIRGVANGKTKAEVLALLGACDYAEIGTSQYIWNYYSLNVSVRFNYSTDKVVYVIMNDPNQIEFHPQ